MYLRSKSVCSWCDGLSGRRKEIFHSTDRIKHTTAFVTSVVEHWLGREIAQWVDPMKDRSDDPSHHERTLLPRSGRQIDPSWWTHCAISRSSQC